jgi:hypothetical protein
MLTPPGAPSQEVRRTSVPGNPSTRQPLRSRCLLAWVAMVNRTQALVLGFFLLAWTSLLVILATAPEAYNQALRLPTGHRAAQIAFLAALTIFIALLAVGVMRRWRWTFWLVLIAFLLGVLRVPVAIAQLMGILAATGPIWYVAFQGLLGVLQLAIGLAMLVGYRRAGVWGAF